MLGSCGSGTLMMRSYLFAATRWWCWRWWWSGRTSGGMREVVAGGDGVHHVMMYNQHSRVGRTLVCCAAHAFKSERKDESDRRPGWRHSPSRSLILWWA